MNWKDKRLWIGILAVVIVLIFLAIIGVFYYPISMEAEINCDEMNPLFCQKDEDCVCKQERGCFMGNKNYYSECVNDSIKSSWNCQDLCSQELCKCVNNTCNCGEGFA